MARNKSQRPSPVVEYTYSHKQIEIFNKLQGIFRVLVIGGFVFFSFIVPEASFGISSIIFMSIASQTLLRWEFVPAREKRTIKSKIKALLQALLFGFYCPLSILEKFLKNGRGKGVLLSHYYVKSELKDKEQLTDLPSVIVKYCIIQQLCCMIPVIVFIVIWHIY